MHEFSRFSADQLKPRLQILRSGQHKAWTDRLYWLAVVTVIGLVVAWQMAHLGGFRWNVDEGIDLMKAELVRAGYPLYTQTYSDQPPGLTLALVVLFNLIGTSIEAGRAVVVVFTSALTLLLQTPLWPRHHLVVLLFPAVTLACAGLDDLVYGFHCPSSSISWTSRGNFGPASTVRCGTAKAGRRRCGRPALVCWTAMLSRSRPTPLPAATR